MISRLAPGVLLFLLAGAGMPAPAGDVDWAVNGGDPAAAHFSDLDEIRVDNVAQLGLAWWLDLDAPDGIAATPVETGGVIYLSGPFAVVYAVNARTGKLVWRFDPQVARDRSINESWSARFNRGVAVWGNRVLVGTGDCRLIALDRATGKPAWSRQACDTTLGYAITGAPYVGGGKVFIGNSGSESGQKNRGFVSAFDIDSGRELWRFYTVPRGDAVHQEAPYLERALASWNRRMLETYGGGGNVWDSMTYDPRYHMLFFGTAGALPYVYKYRNPDGGDNLYTSSVMAVNADTGEYVWHYQTVPHDSWDYNADMNIVLATLPVNGAPRDVVLVAPKNGFLYVLDRRTGEFLSARNYTRVNWAKSIDPHSGRPVPDPAASFWEHPDHTVYVWPNMWGAHSWQPMAYHPGLGLVYIPAVEMPEAVDYTGDGEFQSRIAFPPGMASGQAAPGRLVAWDPLRQHAAWSADRSLPYNGGVLATRGNLVFQGTGSGDFEALAADSGKLLWRAGTGSAVSAAPVTYRLDGVQYVLVPAGAGGGLRFNYPALTGTAGAPGPARLLAYRLGGTAVLPGSPGPAATHDAGTSSATETAGLRKGADLYREACALCHGADAIAAAGGSVPDLRRLSPARDAQWDAIVIGGALHEKGMLPANLTVEESRAIHAYVSSRARAQAGLVPAAD